MNVILIVIDSLRKDHVGAYGNGWIQTPNLDAFARESLRFTRAQPESTPTIPARRTIHTGLRTFPFRDWDPHKGESVLLYGWQPIPEQQWTLAEILQAEGYETMLVTDSYHEAKAAMNFQRGFSVFDFIRGQENDHYQPMWMCPKEKIENTLLSGDRKNVEGKMRQYFANTAGRAGEQDYFGPQVFSRAARFLEGASKSGRPFFLTVDSFDPHEPWDPPEEYVKLYSDGYHGPEPYTSVYGGSDYLEERELERMKALYAGEVSMVDRWFGNFLDKVESLGLMEDTMIVLLSDHGHALGEHGVVGKPPYALWPEVTDVPFMIRHPEGRRAGDASDYYASTHDVSPTILSALGVEPPSPMDGQDLSVFFDGGEPEARPYFVGGLHDHVWVRDEDYAMISRNTGSGAKLYDLKADPDQQKNIAWRNPGVVKHMFEDYVVKEAGGEPPPNYDT